MSRRPRPFAVALLVLTMFVPLAAQGRPTDYVGGTKQSPPVNTSPPQTVGTPTAGATLTTSLGSWTGTGISFHYQWYRCSTTTCAAIAGATSSAYALAAAELGSSVFDLMTATNRYGSTTASTQRVLVLPAAPAVVTAPGIAGIATRTFAASRHCRRRRSLGMAPASSA